MLGVNYIGYFNEPCGLTEATISNVNALEKSGIDVNVVSYLFNHKRDSYNNRAIEDSKKHEINIFHINIGTIKKFIKDLGKSQFKNKYNIAFWVWEFMEIPKEILPYMSLFDEIWTASDFCVKIFSQKALCPVICFPHPIEIPNSNLNRKELDLPEDKFIFLTIFDSHSAILRKNPFAVVQSFKDTFDKDNNDVLLLVKCINLDDFPEEKNKFHNLIKDNTNIKILNERISRTELTGLIQNCDSLVSLHRSEGFGLTMAEAMYFKKPVIATGYSGNMEFMNINNSFPVKYTLSPLKSSHGMIKKGFIGADASVQDASIKMKEIFKQNNKDVALNAQQTIMNDLSYLKIGNLMKERLLYAKQKKKKTIVNKLFRL